MTYFLISCDADTLTGMRMAGISGVLVTNRQEAEAAVDRAAADPNIGILIVTQPAAALCGDKLLPLKADGRTPLAVEIPQRGGSPSDSIVQYIRQAVGIQI